MLRNFKQVDRLHRPPYRGNPVAVVLDGKACPPKRCSVHQLDQPVRSHLRAAAHAGGRGLPPAHLLPGRELPFAGHPTLGSCHAWLEAGGRPRGEYVVQECGVGLVKLKRDDERLAFAAPPLRKSGPLPEEDVALIARGWAWPAATSSATPGATTVPTGAV